MPAWSRDVGVPGCAFTIELGDGSEGERELVDAPDDGTDAFGSGAEHAVSASAATISQLQLFQFTESSSLGANSAERQASFAEGYFRKL